MLRGQRFENDVVIVLVNDGSRPLVDFEIFSKPAWNYDLPFHGEHHGVCFGCWIHNC